MGGGGWTATAPRGRGPQAGEGVPIPSNAEEYLILLMIF